MEVLDEKLTKLPKWAQSEMRHLRHQVRELRAELDARHQNTPTKLALIDYSHIGTGVDPYQYESDRGPVSFAFRNNDHHDCDHTIECHILDRWGELVLEITGNYYIIPRAGNQIWLIPSRKE